MPKILKSFAYVCSIVNRYSPHCLNEEGFLLYLRTQVRPPCCLQRHQHRHLPAGQQQEQPLRYETTEHAQRSRASSSPRGSRPSTRTGKDDRPAGVPPAVRLSTPETGSNHLLVVTWIGAGTNAHLLFVPDYGSLHLSKD